VIDGGLVDGWLECGCESVAGMSVMWWWWWMDGLTPRRPVGGLNSKNISVRARRARMSRARACAPHISARGSRASLVIVCVISAYCRVWVKLGTGGFGGDGLGVFEKKWPGAHCDKAPPFETRAESRFQLSTFVSFVLVFGLLW
jgi:hypothetical protein